MRAGEQGWGGVGGQPVSADGREEPEPQRVGDTVGEGGEEQEEQQSL